MRKINRDNLPPVDVYLNGPNIRISKWRVAENNVIAAFKNQPVPFHNGDYVFRKNPSYDKWKQELINIQGKKCCFCEKAIQNGVIEHFRPKKGWQQNEGDPITRPGYYWLAYRWRNLLLSCTECNESGQKGNLFPINNVRATNVNSNLNDELAELINPYEEEPSTFLSFYNSEPISLHPKGHKTIEILKLKDRADIAQNRKDIFDLYQLSYTLSQLPYPIGNITQEMIDAAKERVRFKIKMKQPFSGMININFPI